MQIFTLLFAVMRGNNLASGGNAVALKFGLDGHVANKLGVKSAISYLSISRITKFFLE
ncbi:hypothetical protein Bpfe_022540, partial [Biomphalaria pfeifferi]